jgi:environmental stress-induced protein Ves
MRILRAADRIATPWKNGGGVTREVALWPPDSTFDTFDWRVSLAEVREAGPFSVFENIDRTMAILEGRLALTFADREVELDGESTPFAFAGDESCYGAPLGGPVTDLNVMARRGRATAHVNRIVGEVIVPAAKHLLVLAINPMVVHIGPMSTSLHARDALLVENPRERELVSSSTAFLIALS